MRPKISPIFLSQLVEQAPGRVRKRFDSEPSVAESWNWIESGNEWTIHANEETVRLQPTSGVITRLEEVSCSCLMSPKCFHILACCGSLPLEQNQATEEETVQEQSHEALSHQSVLEPAAPSVEVSTAMRVSAKLVRDALAALLRVGAHNAGILLQSGLLRAGHASRASDLYALSNTVLRIAEGVQRFRQRSDEADSLALKEDIAAAFVACHALLSQASVPKWIVGQARRVFESLDVRKLDGVFAEPILTRSGFAGVSVYLQSPNQDGLFTINELRTGDTCLIHQAYRGGIELGGITQEAKVLCRSSFAVQALTVSDDGRLGKGKSTRWAIAKRELNEPFSSGRFAKTIAEQLEGVFAWLKIPSEQRPGGWDLIALTALVQGASGATVVVEMEGSERPWRLGVMIDSSELEYRHNLEMIARCPGLRLRCLVRVRIDVPYCADLLAIGAVQNTSTEIQMELPEAWQGICNTGLDRLERHFVRGIERWPEEIALDTENDPGDRHAKYTTAIERRLVGLVLGGRDAIPVLGSKSHRRDCNQLKKLFLPTGAHLLEHLATKAHEDRVKTVYDSRAALDSQDESVSAFLACDTYNRAIKESLALSQWTD